MLRFTRSPLGLSLGRLCLIGGLGAACWMLPACQTMNSTERDESRAAPTEVVDQRVERDRTLNRKARVIGVREATTESGLLKIQVEVQNITRNPRLVNYRFEWVDRDGMLVSTSTSNWKLLSIASNESVMLAGVAPTPEVVDFRFKVLEAKRERKGPLAF